ncbi:TPA: hypothetical protein ACGJSI_004081 [Pseudomonas aeruginosa]|uniref:hypothetical protein n=1 Tax=Pseudomonas aeruginosa TaxID=287 RepID=UPI00053D251A|nr:hypothetical protein [Pseudomonas aeruginosa]HCK5034766.1 hypothetical protein [Pseudomonas aeruginosa]
MARTIQDYVERASAGVTSKAGQKSATDDLNGATDLLKRETEPKAIVGRTRTGYDRPVTVNGVLMGCASFAKCYPVSWWNYQPADGGRLEQHADLSRVRDRAVQEYKRKHAVEAAPATVTG